MSFVEEVYKKIGEYVSWLKKNFKVKLVVLFGSLTKNSWVEGLSDADLLIVAEGLASNPMENYEKLKIVGVIEPLAYNPESLLEALRNLKNFVVFDALEDGKIIFAEKEYLDMVYKVFREAKKRYNLRRDKNGWRFSRLPEKHLNR